MVSKTAVIAIVAILAVPILLGYAMNIQQVQETDYKSNDDPVNVTPLLQNGEDYNYAHGNAYQLNSDFRTGGVPIFPLYEKYSNTYTSFKLSFDKKFDGYIPSGTFVMSNYTSWAWQFDYNSDVGYLIVTLTDTNSQSQTYNKIHTIYVDYNTNTVYMNYYTNGYNVAPTSLFIFHDIYSISFSNTANYHADETYQWYDRAIDTKYIDLSSGYRFTNDADHAIMMPSNTRSVLMSINLDSITDPNYSVTIGNRNFGLYYDLIKTTIGSDVKWQVRDSSDHSRVWDLVYNPQLSSNTYQFYMSVEFDRSDNGTYYYDSHCEFRYIGKWQKTIGEANYYYTVSDDRELSYHLNTNLSHIYIKDSSLGKTPIFRVDDALFKAYSFPIIENQTYSPSSFKSNPATSINSVDLFGPSFTFGGNTYTVSNGNITLGTHKIPVNGMVLDSIPNADVGYDNRINGTVISTTATPSTITFNGKWGASISTVSLTSYTTTKTEWKAGDFAWDGIDQNFIMAGLLASLGAFVGVGIYARRTKSSVWPLLIVCGGAALLFFVML